MPVIGLVGGIGAGKSLVAKALVEHGATLLDADAIGHILLEQSPCRDRVLERFGEAILAPQDEEGVRRQIDRRVLGAIAFSNPGSLRSLEGILHPAMRKTFEKAISREARRARVPALVLDAAILYEAGWDDLCDLVIFVDAPEDQRLGRLAETRGWSAETLAAREKVQGPLEEKRREAGFKIMNDSTPEALRAAVKSLWPSLIARPRRLPGGSPAPRGQPTS